MGRIRNGYRTKDEIVQDIVFVLNAPVAEGTKEIVMRTACWVWTEFEGKYDGCVYWSKAATVQELRRLKARIQYLEQPLDAPKPPRKVLIHEHVVPKQVICQTLRELSPVTVEGVRYICEKFLIGAVVTREEDKRLNSFRQSMPSEFFDSASPDNTIHGSATIAVVLN